MLESGLEGAAFAGFTAALGLLQAFLTQRHRSNQERPVDLLTLYFLGHLLAALVLFCIWKILSPLIKQHLAFKLLLENAWIESLGITLSSCLRTTSGVRKLHTIFRYVAAMTYVLHVAGFILLLTGQDNGKPMLFGASLLLPSSLLTSFAYVRSNGVTKTRRPNLLWIYGLFSICGLIALTAIRSDDKFLQSSVIFASVTSLVPVCLPFFRSANIARVAKLRSPRPATFRWSCKGLSTREKEAFAQQHDGSLTQSLHRDIDMRRWSTKWSVCESKSTQDTCSPPNSPLLPPALIHHSPSRSD